MNFLIEMLGQAFDRIASGDADLVATTLRTVELAVVATAIAMAIGLPLAVWLGSGTSRPRRIGLIVANTGLGLPPVALGVYVALALEPLGPLGRLGWSDTLRAMVVAQTLLALPLVVALTAAAIRALPGGLLSQAEAFGASPLRRAALALREARIGVVAAVIAALGSALAEVGAVVIVGGNDRGHTNTLASTVLLDINASSPGDAMAEVIVLVVLLLVLGALLTLVQQRGAPSRRGAA